MTANTGKKKVWQSIIIFTGMPLFIWAMSTFPERSLLKELLSVMTILAFCQVMGLFFWTRLHRSTDGDISMSKVIKYHIATGYVFVVILLFHPFFLVSLRFFEPGVAPVDAFVTIISTLHQGVVLGIIAWCLLLVVGITSFVRKKLPIQYKTWRVFHGMLAMFFIVIATWHVINLGRHSGFAMSIFVSTVAGCEVLLLLKKYTVKKIRKTSEA